MKSKEKALALLEKWYGKDGRNKNCDAEIWDEMLNDMTLAFELGSQTPLTRKIELETIISGHMEAMRPLLDEWINVK